MGLVGVVGWREKGGREGSSVVMILGGYSRRRDRGVQ